MTAFPKLLAHRGIGNPYTIKLGLPENSIPAIQYAAANGADFLDGDVHVSGKSSSGSRIMFLMHDELLDRTTNGSGHANERPWSYITERWLEIPRDLDGNGDYDNTKWHPPSLRAWLKAAKETGLPVSIELKNDLWTEVQVRKFAEEIKAQELESKTFVSGGATKLKYIKKHLPEAGRCYSVNEKPAITTVKAVVGSSGYASISLVAAEESPTYVKNLQAAGIRVIVYTLDTDSHYKRALPFNFYGWWCDNVDHASKWLTTNLT